MKKIPKKFEFLVFPFLMACMMSFLMSGVITFLNLGLPSDFLEKWIRAFGSAFIIAYPIVLFVAPLAKKLAHHLVEEK